MCPGCDSQTQRHMWVEFVGSLNSQRNVMMRFETLKGKAMVSMKYFLSSVHCLCVLILFRRQ